MKKVTSYILVFILVSCQHQTLKTNLDAEENSVEEKSFIELGGEKQYVEMTGVSNKHPVLLFLHGGPGWPQTPHLRYFNSALTKSVILISWDQSGCGKSYMANPSPKNLNKTQLISDAHELTFMLKKKFKQDKIYLAGFSWGSILGLELVKKYPEDYAAYFGISQVIDMNRSMTLSINWLREQALLKGDKKMLGQLEKLERKDTTLCKGTLECFFKKYEFLTAYGGAIHRKESEEQIKIAETKFEDYKNYDWLNGFLYSFDKIGNIVFETDFTTITKLDLPVYFFLGRHDHSLPAIVTEDFVNHLTAPKKEIVWFENSGHEPLEEEAGKFNQAIIERISK